LFYSLKDLEDASWIKRLNERKVYNEKRVIVRKEGKDQSILELRLKDIQQEVSDLRECIKRER
jgi:hypothetical protein